MSRRATVTEGPRRARAWVPWIGLALTLCAGCSGFSEWRAFDHELVVDSDTIDDLGDLWPAGEPCDPPEGGPYRVDVLVAGARGDARYFFGAALAGLERHPGLVVGDVILIDVEPERRLSSGIAPVRSARLLARTDPGEAEALVQIGCRPTFSGSWVNPLIAFPGMIPFAPVWLGYFWDLELELEARVSAGDRAFPAVSGAVQVAFREKNARRSAMFHLWPSTGFFGTQFVMGLVLAPTFVLYDEESETTPALVEVLEPRLGAAFARMVFAEVARRLEETRTPKGATPPAPRGLRAGSDDRSRARCGRVQ